MTIGRKGRALKFIALALGIAAFCSVFMFSCETDRFVINLALKKEGKTFLFSKMGSFIVENNLKKNESPSAFPFIQLFSDDGLFVAPRDLEEIVNVMSGNYKLYPYQEKSYDGYLTKGEENVFESDFKNVSTDKIGEQIRHSTVTLTDLESNRTHVISWELNPKTQEIKAIKNCEVKSFWIKTFVQPGESVTATDDFIMVNLNDIVAFYGNKSTIEFNEEELLLYIQTE